MSEDPGLIGDNSLSIVRALRAEAQESLAHFEQRRDQFAAAMAKFVTIRDRLDVGNAGDLIGMARSVFDMVDARRKALVAPHDKAIDAVNALFREFWQPVENAVADLRRKLDQFAADEQTRIDAQEEEQRRFEQAARAAQAPRAAGRPVDAPPADDGARKRTPAAPKRQNVRGDYGANVVFGQLDVIEIENWRELPDFIMDAADVREAIIKVARPMVKQKIVIPGLTVTKAAATSVRR
jgi:hypothetical protein